MIPVALGLGSNKSYGGMSCLQILRAAVAELEKLLSGLECSGVYKTRAMYYLDQDDFYNFAVMGFFDNDAYGDDGASAFELLDAIHEIEARFGRDRSAEIRNGPRPLDIDIELYGSQTIDADVLTVPHLRLKERAFVLVPLVEILAKDADNIKWKGLGQENILGLKDALFALCGREIPDSRNCGVEKFMDSKAFLDLPQEELYGTRDAGTDKGSRN